MKTRDLILIVLTFFFTGCDSTIKNELLKKETVVISGKIESIDSELVSINFQDIVRGSAYYTQIVDTLEGTFKFIFDIYHGQDLRFKYNNTFLILYVEPSDSLFLRIDSKELVESNNGIKFSGNNKIINEEIQKFRFYKKVPAFNPVCEGKSVKEYHADLNSQIETELAELDRFVKKFAPSVKFIQWAQNDIIYNNSNYLIDYKAHLSFNKLPRADSIFDMSMFPIDNESALASSMFGYHIWHYASDTYIQSNTEVMDFLNNKNYYDAYKIGIRSIMQNEQQGLVRDIMIYKFMTTLLRESITDFERLYNSNNYKINNQLLVSELEQRLVQAIESSEQSITSLVDSKIMEYGDRLNFFDILINESEGKTLYVDFWALWCGPCLAEIPSLIELHEKIKNENIQIASICCGSDRNAWLGFLNDNSIPGKHYHIDKQQEALLRATLNFQGYPTYMIIKDGIIIDTNAYKPSSGERILNELLRINAL